MTDMAAAPPLASHGPAAKPDLHKPLDHARAVVRRRRHDGRQPIGAAMVNRAQPADGLGADLARGHPAVGRAVLRVPVHLLMLWAARASAPGADPS